MSHLTDPTTAFPQPPFPEQKQPVPGDFYKMDPAPDHGEKTYEGHGRLAGRRALITGGDSGIGRAVAIAFLPGDIAKEEVCQQLVADTVSKLGGIDLLVMVAGIMPTVDSIDDLDTGVLDHVMKTNIYSLFWLTKAASPHLEPGSGIITTGSIQSFQPSPSLAEYATSKAGITNWTRAMAGQLAERGIRVNGVAPGPFWTPLQPSSVPMEKLTSFGEDTPFGRPGQPAELASTYVYLASNESSYTSGETIVVNGGTTGH